MKKLMVMCGTGVATSTLVSSQIKDWLAEKKLINEVQIYQGKIADEINRLDEFDIIVSTTAVPEKYAERSLNSLPLLQGIGVEDFYSNLETMIKR